MAPTVHGLDVIAPAHLVVGRHVHRLVLDPQSARTARIRSFSLAEQHRVTSHYRCQRSLQAGLAHALQHLVRGRAFRCSFRSPRGYATRSFRPLPPALRVAPPTVSPATASNATSESPSSRPRRSAGPTAAEIPAPPTRVPAPARAPCGASPTAPRPPTHSTICRAVCNCSGAAWRQFAAFLQRVNESMGAKLCADRAQRREPARHVDGDFHARDRQRNPALAHWRDFGGAQLTPEQAAEQLCRGESAVEVRPSFSEGLEIAVWMLAAGEDRVVGRRVRSVLAAAPSRTT